MAYLRDDGRPRRAVSLATLRGSVLAVKLKGMFIPAIKSASVSFRNFGEDLAAEGAAFHDLSENLKAFWLSLPAVREGGDNNDDGQQPRAD
jgi:hypothetical protein